MPLLPRLVSPEGLRDALGDEWVRVFDATVFLRRAVDGGPYTLESGRARWRERKFRAIRTRSRTARPRRPSPAT